MIIKKKLFVLSLLVLFSIGCSTSYDVVIKEGTIHDGRGGAPYVADIGIQNGAIKTIGKIRKYVMEKTWITMGQAIRAATSLPAEVLDLDDRGSLEKGYVADIVVFDPDKISDKATFDTPHQYSEGIRYLFINGKPVIENGDYNGNLVGKPLRMNKK